jgi:hypothetical protein
VVPSMLADPHTGLRKPFTDLLFLRYRRAPDWVRRCPVVSGWHWQTPVDHGCLC